MTHTPKHASVEIVEVGPRDGFQGIGPFIPTETKIAMLERLVAAGLRRIEIGSFVSACRAATARHARTAGLHTHPRPRSSSPGTERAARQRCRAGRRAMDRLRAVGDGVAQPQQRPPPPAGVGRGIPAPARDPGGPLGTAEPRDGLRLPSSGRVPEEQTLPFSTA